MNNPKFDALLNKMSEIHDSKNSDYASTGNPYSNFEFAALISADFQRPLDRVFATLIGIKMARLQQLCGTNKQVSHEPINDTLLDLANYAAIWASYYREDSCQD